MPREHQRNLSLDRQDPSTLFNLAVLSIHVPTEPLPPPPASTSLARSRTRDNADVDRWVTQLANAAERELAYYDESLPFYLLLQLPPVPLTREQATAFLLPSLNYPAHLSLSAELSYVEGHAAPVQQLPPVPFLSNPPSRRGGASLPQPDGLGISRPNSTAGARLDLRTRAEPISPAPFPSTRASDAPFIESQGITVWSYAFVPAQDGEAAPSDDPKSSGKTKERVFGEGRVWVGKHKDSWIGVWEFRGDVAWVRSPFSEPKLCLTITTTFRDDPRLAVLLHRSDADRTADGEAQNSDDDEYMMESYDDVNLLEGLSHAYDLHLPASRLPFPSVSLDTSQPLHRRSSSIASFHRRESLSTHRRSFSPSTEDGPLYPAVRRAFRRVLDVRSALSVKMRTVPCPVSGLNRQANWEGRWDDVLMEENEGMGLAMCIEVAGCGNPGDEMGFEVESVTAEVAGDVEVKPIEPSEFPVVLKGVDQHNFLYSITYSTPEDSESFEQVVIPPPIPIHLAVSPSHRFASRMGDFQLPENLDASPVPQKRIVDVNWSRNVGITVVGRPIRVKAQVPNGRSLLTSYSVSNSHGGAPGGGAAEGVSRSPTEPFASRWNCLLDISPCAVPLQSRRAAPFLPSTIVPPPPGPIPPSALRPITMGTSSSRKQSKPIPLEAIAGSKRHTMASLAALATKSPPMLRHSRPSSLPPSEENRRDSSFVEGPTPGATGPPKRFFSLPPVPQGTPPPESMPRIASDRSSSPMPLPSGSGRLSTPSFDALRASPAMPSSEAKRESWTRGLNGGATAAYSAPLSVRTPQNGSPSLDVAYPQHDVGDVSAGSIVVSVALLPLKAAHGESDLRPMSMSSPLSPTFPTTGMTQQGQARRMPRVGLLDVFLVEVFVVNQSDEVKRFTVGVPARVGVSDPDPERVAHIVALENDVRIGPLAPNTCHSVRLKFLAVRPGAHQLEELRLVDLATGYETRLRNPIQVVVV